jgi:hypothetical protein
MGADDLLSAIAVYRGMPFARTNAHLHPEIRDIVFSNADLANIARFLRALTDERVEARTGVFATPSIRLPTVEATNAAGVSPASALRCVAASPPSDGVSLGCAEVCNGRDDDGNGRIDDGAGVCTDPVRQFNGHSYIFSATRAMTFDQAVGWCNAQGYDLVTPSTAAENDWLWDVAWNARDNQGLINTEAWIGLLSEAGALRWVNGDPGTTFALAEPAPVDGNRWGAYTAHGPTAANWRFSRTGISKRVICESR